MINTNLTFYNFNNFLQHQKLNTIYKLKIIYYHLYIRLKDCYLEAKQENNQKRMMELSSDYYFTPFCMFTYYDTKKNYILPLTYKPLQDIKHYIQLSSPYAHIYIYRGLQGIYFNNYDDYLEVENNLFLIQEFENFLNLKSN